MKCDNDDRLKIRRRLALFSALFALIIWPHEMIILTLVFDVSVDIVKALLLYITALAGTTIGAYLWACYKQDGK